MRLHRLLRSLSKTRSGLSHAKYFVDDVFNASGFPSWSGRGGGGCTVGGGRPSKRLGSATGPGPVMHRD